MSSSLTRRSSHARPGTGGTNVTKRVRSASNAAADRQVHAGSVRTSTTRDHSTSVPSSPTRSGPTVTAPNRSSSASGAVANRGSSGTRRTRPCTETSHSRASGWTGRG